METEKTVTTPNPQDAPEAERWDQKIRDLGYLVSYKEYMDREGPYWKIIAMHKKTKKCRSATDRLFARSTDAVAEKLYKKLVAPNPRKLP